MRFAVVSDTHLAPPGTADGRWNNVTRVSASRELLDAVVAEIAAAGHDRVLLLGDISDLGVEEAIATVVETISDAGMQVWAVPGNHDVRSSQDAFADALRDSAMGVALRMEHGDSNPEVVVSGHGLRAEDVGGRFVATDLPDLAPVQAQLLVWATHFPVLSQETRLLAEGLRYPGDLLNLADVQSSVSRFHGPALVLHGHLHAAVVAQAGQILQIGVPAVVEWPHAWTDASIEFTTDTVTVQTTLIPIPGAWSNRDVNTVLAEPEQCWVFETGRWRQTPASDPR